MQADELQREIDRIKALDPAEVKAERIAQVDSSDPARIKAEQIAELEALDPMDLKAEAIAEFKNDYRMPFFVEHYKFRDPAEFKALQIGHFDAVLTDCVVSETKNLEPLDPEEYKAEEIAQLKSRDPAEVKAYLIAKLENARSG